MKAKLMNAPLPMQVPPSPDPLHPPREASRFVGLSLPAFWAGVRTGRLPAPFYPAPRAPRWRESELRAALETTRMLPVDAVAARRAAKLAQSAA
jgi:predicted DNA-binding transcriptional regulator AlpA